MAGSVANSSDIVKRSSNFWMAQMEQLDASPFAPKGYKASG